MNVFEKISEQQQGKENTTVWMVGEQLKDILHKRPQYCEMVLQDMENNDMSIAKAEQKIKEYADELHKKSGGNSVGITDVIAENFILGFYGIPKEDNQDITQESKNDSPFIDLESFI